MVKHIILWKLKDELTATQKAEIKNEIKAGLEQLVGLIPGLTEIKVITEGRLDTSNADIMLYSCFENEEALKNYASHPSHVAVADTKIRPYTAVRTCLDFEE